MTRQRSSGQSSASPPRTAACPLVGNASLPRPDSAPIYGKDATGLPGAMLSVRQGTSRRGLNQRQHTDDQLMTRLALLTRKIGRFPMIAQMRMERRQNPDFFAERVIDRRFGDRAAQLLSLRAFIERTPEFADLAAMLPVVADEPVPDSAVSSGATSRSASRRRTPHSHQPSRGSTTRRDRRRRGTARAPSTSSSHSIR